MKAGRRYSHIRNIKLTLDRANKLPAPEVQLLVLKEVLLILCGILPKMSNHSVKGQL